MQSAGKQGRLQLAYAVASVPVTHEDRIKIGQVIAVDVRFTCVLLLHSQTLGLAANIAQAYDFKSRLLTMQSVDTWMEASHAVDDHELVMQRLYRRVKTISCHS